MQCAARTACGARGAVGFENILAQRARIDDFAPQLALLDVAEDARRAGVPQLPPGMLFPQPAAEIEHARGGPNIESSLEVSALHRIEQRRRKFGIRREDGMAGGDGRQQAAHIGFRAQCC